MSLDIGRTCAFYASSTLQFTAACFPLFVNKMNVLIAGAEVEALVCALALKKMGITPTLLYPSSTFSLTEDRGVIIPINATRIFDRLGVGDRLETIGNHLHMFTKMDHLGNQFGHINFKELANVHGFHAVATKKSDLLKTLEALLVDDSIGPPVRILRQHHIAALRQFEHPQGGVRVEATIKRPPGATKQAPLKINQTPLKGKDGTNPTKVAGNTSDTSDDEKQIFDIVIGAEGYYSRVRELLWSNDEVAQKVACGRYFTTIERPKTFPSHGMIEMMGPGNLLGAVSLGNEVYIWGTFKPKSAPSADELLQKVAPSMFIDAFPNYGGPWKTLAAEVSKKAYVHLDYPVETIIKTLPVYNRVGLIGQSARGIAPLIQGHDVGQYIEDAITAAECIAQKVIPLEFALRKYAVVRKERATQVQKTASTALQSLMATQDDWRMKLKYYLLKLDNSTRRLTEKENDLIGIDESRMKGRV